MGRDKDFFSRRCFIGNDGRVLVRVSGTEPLVRVMLEGKDKAKIQSLGEAIADVVRERLV